MTFAERADQTSTLPDPYVITSEKLRDQLFRFLGAHEGALDLAEHVEELMPHMREVIAGLTEQADSDPANHPDNVIARITSQYREDTPLANNPVTTLDHVMSRYGPNLKRFRQVGLAPYDEIALLKATAFAGFSRNTDRGYDLARSALRILHHEATNISNSVDESIGVQSSVPDRFARVFYSMRALEELYSREEAEPITSIDETLRRWGEIDQPKENGEIADTFLPDPEIYPDKESRVGFRRLVNVEVGDRIKGLRVVGTTLKESLGESVSVRYFETVIFDDRSSTIQAPEISIDNPESEVEEQSNYFSSDYVVAEIIEQLADGSKMVHIVAESPHYGNACYVLRGDTRATLGEALGESIDWRRIFSYPKVTARQLGARDFRHANGSNVPKRVLDHLSADVVETLKPITQRWFMADKPLYDAELGRTEYNRLPIELEKRVSEKLSTIREIMFVWLGTSPVGQEKVAQMGDQILRSSGLIDEESEKESNEDTSSVIDTLERRNEELLLENERLKLDKLLLEEKLTEIRKLLN